MTESKKLLTHYVYDCSQEGFIFFSFVNVMACKCEYLAFKLQAITKWGDKTCRDLWGMITWNHSLQTRYPNLFVLVDLVIVQCVSTTTYKKAFHV